jgi:hypothetical protein
MWPRVGCEHQEFEPATNAQGPAGLEIQKKKFRTLTRNTNDTYFVVDYYYMGGLQFFVQTFMDTSSSFMAVHQLVTVMDTSSMGAPPFAALGIIPGYKDG